MQGMATYTLKIYCKIPKEIINLGRLVGGKVLKWIGMKGVMRVSRFAWLSILPSGELL